MADELQVLTDRDDAQYRPLGQVKEASVIQFNEILAKDPYMISHWLDGIKHGVMSNLTEQIAPGDFPTLFGFMIQRDLLARYSAVVSPWRAYTKTGTVPNFNSHEKHKVYGQDNELAQVLPGAPYPITASGTAHYHRQVFKYGRRFDILWESIINDALGAFSDIPERFATAVMRTQDKNVTRLYSSATGPNAALFGAPIVDVDGQNVTNVGVLPLTIANLQTTLLLARQQTDPNGERINIRMQHLVVPDSLEFTARAIMTSALQQQLASAVPVPTVNIIPQLGLQLHVDPNLESIDVSGTGDTTWYVFSEVGEMVPFQMDFLAGHVGPDIRIKSSGSAVNPMEGDFDTDSIAYRVRDVHGGCQLEPRACYAQVGP